MNCRQLPRIWGKKRERATTELRKDDWIENFNGE
jgi:hypothetical protein